MQIKLLAKSILGTDKNMFDSPYKNLVPVYRMKIQNEEHINNDILFEIYMIMFAEKLYFSNLLLSGQLKNNFSNPPEGKGIDVSQLKIGDKFNNYADLCRFLNQKDSLTGKQRQNQTKLFKRFFDWEKTGRGNEIVITKKFIIPKPMKLQNRDKGVYIQYVEHLILAHLYNCENNMDELSQLDLLIKLGFTNNNFRELVYQVNKKRKMEITDLGVNEQSKEEFVSDVQSICYQIIYRAIKSLENRRLITKEKITVIDNHVADIEELDKIREVELKLLKKYGLKTISQVYMNPQIRKCFLREKSKLLSKKYGWEYIYVKYRLKSSHEDILYGFQILNDEIKKELNGKIVRRMTEELNKKEEMLERDIVDVASLFDKDFDTGKQLYDVMKDEKDKCLDDREKYLKLYLQYITHYIQL